MNSKRQAGFTLIELMVVIAIFGVILYISGPLINSAFMFYEAAKRNEVGRLQKLSATRLLD
ncbi:type II secretion system protein [Pseudomonas aeruginosa]|uniref:type II secretion system protein n=1 Tax=Pseudomonas aeruginosa TaxID=287 RepID=UPI003D9C7307